MPATDAWINEPRDEKGRWTTGGADPTLPSSPQRMAYLVNSVVGHLSGPDRARFSTWLDRGGTTASADMLQAYAKASKLSAQGFTRNFGVDRVDTATLLRLRSVAEAAQRTPDISAATEGLAATVKSLGVNRFISLAANLSQPVQAMSDGNTNATSPPPYIAKNPHAFDGKASVGDGECVALVKAATGAPAASLWKMGELVRGNINLPPGTAIAVFDADGRYGNHTNHSSHAAIYLRQDAGGIYVIDQYNFRKPDGTIERSIPPYSTYIKFDSAARYPISDGGRYRVVR